MRTCQRREQLEYMARQKLTSEVRRATDLNNSLSSQLDTSKLDEGKKQTDRRELLIQQLVTQSTCTDLQVAGIAGWWWAWWLFVLFLQVFAGSDLCRGICGNNLG